MWSLYFKGKESDVIKGFFEGVAACSLYDKRIGRYYDLEMDYNRCYNRYHTRDFTAEDLDKLSFVKTEDLDVALRKAQDLYFEYLEKENKTNYEKGFFEGVKLFLNMNREEYCLREYAKISPTEFNNTVQQPTEEPAQELVLNNRTKPRKHKSENIAWTEEDDKLIYSAVKKYTKDFTSLPAGHTREDVLQEAAQAWSERLAVKGGHDPAKGKKSTLLYRVVMNKIQDLKKAADTDKRKVLQNTVEFLDVYGAVEGGNVIGPSSSENTSEQCSADDLNPVPKNLKDSSRWQYEQEKDFQDDEEQE